MADIPVADLRAIEEWCTSRVPEHLRNQLRVECRRRGSTVTIVERRAPFAGAEWTEQKVARLRLDGGRWSSNWADRDGRWQTYPGAPVTDTVAAQSPRSIATRTVSSGSRPAGGDPGCR
jgi:DUF3024 family protein